MSFSISAQYIAFRFEVSNFVPWCLANYLAAQSCRHFRQCQKLSFHDVFRVTGWQWWHGSWIPMDPYGSLWIPQVWWRMQRLIWDLQWLLALDIVLFGYLILGGWRKEDHKMEDQASLEHRVCPKIHDLNHHYPHSNGHGFGVNNFETPKCHIAVLLLISSYIPLHPNENPMKASLNHHWISGAVIDV